MLTDDLPGTGGQIRKDVDDFFVEEVPAYLPCGEGEHLMVFIEKVGLTSDEAAQELAQALQVPARDIGMAGRKDKYARTRQWMSLPGREPAQLLGLELPGLQVLDAGRHRNKLRLGHLKGNRFQIVVRGVTDDAAERTAAIVERISAEGLPNFFGPQRFGRLGRNITSALAWIVGGQPAPRKRHQRQLLVSALQAWLFNGVVARRLATGTWTEVLAGDIMKRHETGGLFVADDPETLLPRLRAHEISPTGPIYGAKMWWPQETALVHEEAVLREAGLDRTHLAGFQSDGKGSRRLMRIFPQDVSFRQEGDALTLSFFLDAGAFATTFLAEVTKADDLRAPSSPDMGQTGGPRFASSQPVL